MPFLNVTALAEAYPIVVLARQRNGSLPLPVPTYLLSVGSPVEWIGRARRSLLHYGLCATACYRVERAAGLSIERAVERLNAQGGSAMPSHWVHRGVRDAEPTFAHLRAWAHMASEHSEMEVGLFAEEDLEFWVGPQTLALAVEACAVAAARRTSLASCFLGGCWGVHAAKCSWSGGPSRGCWDRGEVLGPYNLSLETLPDRSQLMGIQSVPVLTGRLGSRCVGFYALTRLGVLRLLLASRDVPSWTHPTDHHINHLAAFDRNLRTSFIEPPMVCQVRGMHGSRVCFHNASRPPASMRRPVRLRTRVAGELGVSGCGAERYTEAVPTRG